MSTYLHETIEQNRSSQETFDRNVLIREALAHLALASSALSKLLEPETQATQAETTIHPQTAHDLHALGSHLIKLSGAQENHTPPTSDERVVPDIQKPLKKPDIQRNEHQPRSKEAFKEGRLHKTVVFADEIPDIEIKEGVTPAYIEITSENTIAVNGQDITLNRDQLFALNGFLKLRNHEKISAGEIFNLGFRPGRTHSDVTSLSIAIRQLREKLNEATTESGSELITKNGEGAGTYYGVSPATIATSVVREGSEVTLVFPDEPNDPRTFKLADRLGRRSNSQARLLDSNLPLAKSLQGKRLNEIFEYPDTTGEPVEVQIVAIT